MSCAVTAPWRHVQSWSCAAAQVSRPWRGSALAPRAYCEFIALFIRSSQLVAHVRFTPKSRHMQCTNPCPLWAKSRHMHRKKAHFTPESATSGDERGRLLQDRYMNTDYVGICRRDQTGAWLVVL